MHRNLLTLAALIAAASVSAQTVYDYTIPTQYNSVNSTVQFAFPATVQTTGGATLSLQWAACYSGGFGASSINVQINTSTGWVDVIDENDNTQSCVFVNESAFIPAGVFADAITVGGGTLQCRMDADDGCQPGVGCSFLNDPVVRNLRLQYTVSAADFSIADATICPGGTVAFTDESINNPSTYLWQFEGGQPATSTVQDPVVQYAAPGTYDVTLIVETEDGPDTLVRTNAVTVYSLPLVNAGADEVLCPGESTQLQALGGVAYQWVPATFLDDPAIADPVTTPTSNINYTVLVTDANGCQGSDAVSIVVQPEPVLSVGAGSIVLCAGDTLSLAASGALLYTWSPNFFISATSGTSVNVWPPDDFNYQLTGTDAFGCSSELAIAVDVVAPPEPPTVVNEAGLLSTSSAASHQWLLEGEPVDGATDSIFIPALNGNYSVIITDENGCTAQSTPVYYGSVGLADQVANHLRVYPQPATDLMVVSGVPAGARLQLIDATGRTVLTKSSTSVDLVTLDVSKLSAGSYIVEVGAAQGVQRVQVVVE
ncbi:MAG: T9SS type A sorting domain-containing protein [Flavobacteriales bacterium]|nr:T9SS type A sorting domain-containing protein [Flavobacteriales bacterium]